MKVSKIENFLWQLYTLPSLAPSNVQRTQMEFVDDETTSTAAVTSVLAAFNDVNLPAQQTTGRL